MNTSETKALMQEKFASSFPDDDLYDLYGIVTKYIYRILCELPQDEATLVAAYWRDEMLKGVEGEHELLLYGINNRAARRAAEAS